MSSKNNSTPLPIASSGRRSERQIVWSPNGFHAFHNKRRGGGSAPPNTPDTPPLLPIGPLSITDASIPLIGALTPTVIHDTPASTPEQIPITAFPVSIFSRSVLRSVAEQEGGGSVAPPNTPATSPEVKAVNRNGRKSVAFEGDATEGSAAGDKKNDAAGVDSGATVKGGSARVEKGDTVGGENKGIMKGEARDTVSSEDSSVTDNKEEDTAMADPTTNDSITGDSAYGDKSHALQK